MLNRSKSVMKWLSTMVMVGIFLALSSPSFANRPTAAEIVIDFDNGQVLHALHADRQLRPASLAKIMTLYLVFEALDANKLSMGERLPVSKTASSRSPAKLYLNRGQEIRVSDAIKALVTKSANDVATVVAERLGGGSERQFARIMTQTARRFGMKNTVFRNASGLHHSRQFSTARDMALLCRRLMIDFPHYYDYFSLHSFRWKGRAYKNHNNLLKLPSVDGIKTGYLRRSGYHVAVSAKRSGRRLIAIVMGGKTIQQRGNRAKFLLNDVFAKVGKKITHRARPSTLPSTLPAIITADQARANIPQDWRGGGSRDGLSRGGVSRGGQGESSGSLKRVASASSGREWMVQVGAFWRRSRAYSMAERSIKAIPPSLEHQADIRIVSRKRHKRRLYLARLVGFAHEQEARTFCQVLKNVGIDCLPIAS